MRRPLPFVLALLAAALIAAAASAQDDPLVSRAERARVTLTPPAGFEVAKEFQGYRHPTTGALIRVAHLSMTYDDARAALSRELLASRGAIETAREEVRTADRRTSTLIEVERRRERLDLRELMLLVGDRTGAALVTATYAGVYESQLRTPLRTALLSTRWVAEGAEVRRPPVAKPSSMPPAPPPKPVGTTPSPDAQPAGATPPPPKPAGPAAPEAKPREDEPGARAPPKPAGALPRPERRGGKLREVAPGGVPDESALVAQLPFAINESRLLPTRRVLGGGLSLAATGKDGRWSDPLFSVFSRERAVPSGPGRTEFVTRLVTQSGAFRSVTHESDGAVRIDDLDGIRSIAIGTFEGGGDALVFKVLLFDSEDYYALTGRCAASERDTYLGEFDRLAQSFRRADWVR